MSLYKRGNTWWTRLVIEGHVIQKSCGTRLKSDAKEYEKKLRAEAWRQIKLGLERDKTLKEAVIRYLMLNENRAKSQKQKRHDAIWLDWLVSKLGNPKLIDIKRSQLTELAEELLEEFSPKTVNNDFVPINAMLKMATDEWEWLDKAPTVKRFKIGAPRVRWLTPDEARRLLNVLPKYMRDIAVWSLLTGLRQSNVIFLRKNQIIHETRSIAYSAEEMKGRFPFTLPLNDQQWQFLMGVIESEPQTHENVFSYNGAPFTYFPYKEWQKYLAKAEIENFTWHDLRHTWASWNIQQGMSFAHLQELGAWRSLSMVQRYAHHSQEHLRNASEKIINISTELSTILSTVNKPSNNDLYLNGRKALKLK